jgi:membrane-associated protein
MTGIGYFLGQIPGVREHIEIVIVIVVFLSILPGIIAGAREWMKKRREKVRGSKLKVRSSE